MVEKTPIDEEKKKIQDDSSSSSEEESPSISATGTTRSKTAFPEPKTREELTMWSKLLHRRGPNNLYYRIKIPWRTILIAFVFFILGSIFLAWGSLECMSNGISEAYEKILLGLILFIPGSYHTFLAIQALRGVPGWNYDNLTTFENE